MRNGQIPRPARPGVLSLHIKERSALFAAYMPFLKTGGFSFPPTRK
jgi:type IV pilus assembly protein PilZ